MDEQPISDADARTLRFLRGLVLVLTMTMIVGMVVLLGLFYQRFRSSPVESAVPMLPARFDLPEGAKVAAVTQARGFWVVVAESGEIFFFDAEGGAPQRVVAAPQ